MWNYVSIGLFCCIAVAPRIARAQCVERAASQQDVAQAQRLFDEAKAEMQSGDLEKACPKFEDSYARAPATGTLLHLAVCHEKNGKLATAWLEFVEAAEATRVAPDRRPYEIAVEHAQALKQKIDSSQYPHLRILLEDGEANRDVVVKLDHIALSRFNLNANIPIDMGEHRIIASNATNCLTDRVLTIGEQRLVPLAISTHTPPPPASPESGKPQEPTTWRAVLTRASQGVVAVGLVGGVVSAVFAHKYRDEYNRSNACAINNMDRCNDSEARAWRMQLVNAGFITAGVVGAATWGVLVLTEPKERVANVIPWVSPHGGGISLTGAL